MLAAGLGLAISGAWAQDGSSQAAPTPVAAAASPLSQRVPGLIVRLRDTRSAPLRFRESAQEARTRLDQAFTGAPLAAGQSRRLMRDLHSVRWARPLEADEAARLMAALRERPDVAWVGVNSYEQPHQVAAPNDPVYGEQWWLSASPSDADSAGVPGIATAWGRTVGGSVNVAVVDSGIRRSHPDLASGRFAYGYDLLTNEDNLSGDGDGWDPDFSDPGDATSAGECGSGDATANTWHGTVIAGMIGADTDNSLGVAGLNRQANIISVRSAGKCGALADDIVDGMRWAAGLSVDGVAVNPNPARIVNVSFGSATADCSVYQAAIDELHEHGVLVVASAGNNASMVHRPARCPGVLAVGAVARAGAKASYSTAGPEIGITTVGGESSGSYADGGLWSTSNYGRNSIGTDGYMAKIGTSFSAPIVSGVASLMLSVNPDLSVDQLIQGLKQTSRAHASFAGLSDCQPNVDQGACNCTTTSCGAGVLDADGAVAWAASTSGEWTGNPDDGNGNGGGDEGNGDSGGGAMGGPWSLGLGAAILLLMAGRRPQQGGRRPRR